MALPGQMCMNSFLQTYSVASTMFGLRCVMNVVGHLYLIMVGSEDLGCGVRLLTIMYPYTSLWSHCMYSTVKWNNWLIDWLVDWLIDWGDWLIDMLYLRIPETAADLELWAEPRNTAAMPFTLHGTPVNTMIAAEIRTLVHILPAR